VVQVTFDTNSDTLEELQEALNILQQAVMRRTGATVEAPAHKAAPKPSKMDIAQLEEETAIDTPFFKITVKEADEEPAQSGEATPGMKMPTLNQLIEDESLTEDELGKLFKEQLNREKEEHKNHKNSVKEENQKEDAYIEIVEYADEKQ
jgi:hypothetical protein